MAGRSEFTDKTKREAYALREGRCPGLVEIRMSCGLDLSEEGYEVDHIKRCEIEPDNSLANARPLCRRCHALKTKMDAGQAAKGRRIRGETKKSQRPKAKIRSAGFPANRDGKWKAKLGGGAERRT